MIRVLLTLLGVLLFGTQPQINALSPMMTINAVNSPAPIAPTGAITPNRMPTFEWYTAPGATWYHLWVSSPSGNGLERWYDGYNICQFDICAVTPGLPLQAGVYQWWIQAWSPTDGYSVWSSEIQFIVNTFTPTPAAPTGTISAAQPAFQWYESSGASWYYLWISGTNGHVLSEWYPASNCAGGMCTVAPVTLPSGEYRWWIQAWQSEGGYSPWSGESRFTIVGSSPLVEPSPDQIVPEVIEPTPEIIEPTPEVIEPTPEVIEPTAETTETVPGG